MTVTIEVLDSISVTVSYNTVTLVDPLVEYNQVIQTTIIQI